MEDIGPGPRPFASIVDKSVAFVRVSKEDGTIGRLEEKIRLRPPETKGHLLCDLCHARKKSAELLIKHYYLFHKNDPIARSKADHLAEKIGVRIVDYSGRFRLTRQPLVDVSNETKHA